MVSRAWSSRRAVMTISDAVGPEVELASAARAVVGAAAKSPTPSAAAEVRRYVFNDRPKANPLRNCERVNAKAGFESLWPNFPTATGSFPDRIFGLAEARGGFRCVAVEADPSVLILRCEAKPSLEGRIGRAVRPSRPAARAPQDEEGSAG